MSIELREHKSSPNWQSTKYLYFRPYITIETESEHSASGQAPKEEMKGEMQNMKLLHVCYLYSIQFQLKKHVKKFSLHWK